MSSLKLKEAALVYLDRSGGLQKFMNDCKYYNGMFSKSDFVLEIFKQNSYLKLSQHLHLYIFTDSKQSYAVYRFNILINPSDAVELDTELGNHILHQPLKAAQVFQSVS